MFFYCTGGVFRYAAREDRLNPCFSGICSFITAWHNEDTGQEGLNPCFSGICSFILKNYQNMANLKVLILVLVEYVLLLPSNLGLRTLQ